MSRTIKFRGLSIKTGQWVYGCYLTDGLEYHAIQAIVKELGSDDDYITMSSGVIKETVGQFTDEHDKNGAEIYEQDKISRQYPFDSKPEKAHCNEVGTVKFVNDMFVKYFDYDPDAYYAISSDSHLNVVIGNIHEQGER